MVSENGTSNIFIAEAFGDALDMGLQSPEGYQVLREIDRGGMAVVYLAEQLSPLREVALKVMLPRFITDQIVKDRFRVEGQAMAELEHAGILPVYQVGVWNGLGFIAMKFADGGTLQELLNRQAPDVRQAVAWIITAGEAVHFAHQRGVLHRDLKPGNLLFDSQGSIYVGDFGVAKMASAQERELNPKESFVGTPHYVAPEMANGTNLGGSIATDVYSLGAVLYECLSGSCPHESCDNLEALFRDLADSDLPCVSQLCPDIPKDLAAVCAKALAKNPEDRYASMIDFVDDLRRWQKGIPVKAKPLSLVEKLCLCVKKCPVITLLSLLVLVTTVGGGFLIWNSKQSLRKSDEKLNTVIDERSRLYQRSLIDRAHVMLLARKPGYRHEALKMLLAARDYGENEAIRTEAVSLLSHWDIGAPGGSDILWVEGGSDFTVTIGDAGLRVTDGRREVDVILPTTEASSCAPAVSEDGKRLAYLRGGQMELIIHNVEFDKQCALIPLRKSPHSIQFAKNFNVIRVDYDLGVSDLYRVTGERLLRNFKSASPLSPPCGLSLWQPQIPGERELPRTGGKLSKCGQFLLTMGSSGIQLWNCDLEKKLKDYEPGDFSEHTLSDTKWLEGQRLLVETDADVTILEVAQNGKFTKHQRNARIDRARVKDVLGNGDWLVEREHEDDSMSLEIWPGGDAESARDSELGTKPSPFSLDDGRIKIGALTLTVPDNTEVLDFYVDEQKRKAMAITADCCLYRWDLNVLREELQRLGLE